MSVFKAWQVCQDIKELGGQSQLSYDDKLVAHKTFYSMAIPISSKKSIKAIVAERYDRHPSKTRFKPYTIWNEVMGISGCPEIVPLSFHAVVNNQFGMLAHAPQTEQYTFDGFGAWIIYNCLKKEYLLARKRHGWEK